MATLPTREQALQRYADRWGYPPLLKDLPKELRADEEVVIASLKIYEKGAINLRAADPKLLASKAFALKVAASKPDNQGLLGEFTEALREDRDVVLAFCADWPHGAQLQFAGPKARADRDIVYAALKSSGMALEFAAPEFRRDFDTVQFAVHSTPHAFQHMDPALLQDRAFLLQFLEKTRVSQGVLQFLSDTLRDDKDIVMAILKTDWQSIQYASERLRGDPEVMWLALTSTNEWFKVTAYESATEGLQRDAEFAKKVVQMVRDRYRRDKGDAVATIMKPHRAARQREREERRAAKEQAAAEKTAARSAKAAKKA